MNAAARYVARLYEAAVDRGLHVEDIRLHLASRGIARSPAMVRHDLDHVFQFAGYADSHPAPPVKTLAQLDAELGP